MIVPAFRIKSTDTSSQTDISLACTGGSASTVEKRYSDRHRRAVRSCDDLPWAFTFHLRLTHAMSIEAAERVFVFVFCVGLEPVSDNLPRYSNDGAHTPRILRLWRSGISHHPAVKDFLEPASIAAKLHYGHKSAR